MNRQSVFFLQAMWDADIEREKVLRLGRENAAYEIESNLRGALHPKTLWISDEAKKLRERLFFVRAKLEEADMPYQLLEISEEYQKITGEIQAMQIRTARTLQAASGPLMPDIHILVRQLFPLAVRKIREQVMYERYRLVVLTGRQDYEGADVPLTDDLEDWVRYYRDIIRPLTDRLDLSILDGRWAYEKKKVTLCGRLSFTQFIAVKPKAEELMMPPGKAGIKTGEEGNVRIHGRGYMTNLTPEDMLHVPEKPVIKRMTCIKDFSGIRSEDEEPEKVLAGYSGERKYLVSAEEYFRFVNMSLIAGEFYTRMKRGNCIDCGMPLYQGICPRCGS